ncbi:MAG TPA: hypothetical protein VFU80_04675, partial [Sphingomicrobium sp.]|nr:hypothetical protein [Sphingomicrobium sp.]
FGSSASSTRIRQTLFYVKREDIRGRPTSIAAGPLRRGRERGKASFLAAMLEGGRQEASGR